jgi:adenine phosphoribosyltransferase
VQRYAGQPVDVVAGFEARGFIFGPPVALALGVPFVPLRKPGKLPGAVVRVEYELEYGTDTLEMHADAVAAGQSVVLIDDLVATGGTLAAGVALIERVGARVHECAAVIELPELRGRDKLGATPLYVQIEKAEHTEEAAAAAAAAVEHAGNGN